MPDSILEPVLHARSMAMSNFPSEIKPVLTPDEADEFVAQRDKAFAEMMKRNDSTSSSMASSPLSALSPDSGTGSMMGGASPTSATNSIIGRGSVSSRNGSFSSSSVASPLSSVSSPPISPPTQSSAAPSPNTPATVQVADVPPPNICANGQYDANGQTRLASVPNKVAAPSPNALTSARKMDTPPLDGATNGGHSVPQTNLASVPKQQGQFTQLQRERPPTAGGGNTVPMGVQEYVPMLTAPSSSSTTAATPTTNPAMEDQNGVQSPPSVGSSLSSISSPPSAIAMSANQMQQQQGGFASDGKFVGNGGGSFSETPSPYNSAISTVSSPPSVFSPEGNMGTGMLHSAVSTDSIPSVGSGLPFQNFHAQNFIPQATTTTTTSMSNSFNTQIPSNFNFNGTTSGYHPTTTSTSAANIQNSTSFATNFVPDNQMYVDNSDHPLLNPNDPVMHQLLSDMVALNSSDPSFSSMATIPPTNGVAGSATNMNTSFSHTHPQAPGNYHHNNFAPSNTNLHASAVIPPQPRSSSYAQPNSSGQANNTFAMSCDIALTQLNVGNGAGGGGNDMSHLLTDPQVPTSNPEVQDILQQFQ